MKENAVFNEFNDKINFNTEYLCKDNNNVDLTAIKNALENLELLIAKKESDDYSLDFEKIEDMDIECIGV